MGSDSWQDQWRCSGRQEEGGAAWLGGRWGGGGGGFSW